METKVQVATKSRSEATNQDAPVSIPPLQKHLTMRREGDNMPIFYQQMINSLVVTCIEVEKGDNMPRQPVNELRGSCVQNSHRLGTGGSQGVHSILPGQSIKWFCCGGIL